MKKVLIVAYYFPPIAASGSMRPLGFCRYLEQFGWTPRVLTTTPASMVPPQDGEEGLRKRVPPQLIVDAVPHRSPLHSLIRFRDRLRAAARFMGERSPGNSPRESFGQEDDRARLYATAKNLILEWLFAFPDPQCHWYEPAVRRLSRLRPDERPDVVLATGGPWTALLVGRRLAARLQIPFIADFRDPWTMNPIEGDRLVPWLRRRARQLEQEVCAAASAIVVNTEEMRREFSKMYPEIREKCFTIVNGFDDDVAMSQTNRTGVDDRAGTVRTPAPRLELSHFGSVYGGRNPRPLLQAALELMRENRIRPYNLRLRFVGAWDVVDEDCETLARALEEQGVARREPMISRERCLEEMSQSQCLLALQGGYPLQIPAKIYEYIATGRPILVIGGLGATAQLINDERLGQCWPNEVSVIKNQLEALATGRNVIERPALNDVKRFHYRALTGRLAEVLDRVTANRS